MSKKKQQNQPKKPKAQPQATPPNTPANVAAKPPGNQGQKTEVVKPEEMSLNGHKHIKKFLETQKKTALTKEDLNAALRLSQHLRVFGLLSAVGYINQSNAQGGKVRERTVPVWGSLLGQFLGKQIDTNNAQQCRELMEDVATMAKERPAEYMATWRESLTLAKQWNFWGRAYAEVEKKEEKKDV